MKATRINKKNETINITKKTRQSTTYTLKSLTNNIKNLKKDNLISNLEEQQLIELIKEITHRHVTNQYEIKEH